MDRSGNEFDEGSEDVNAVEPELDDIDPVEEELEDVEVEEGFGDANVDLIVAVVGDDADTEDDADAEVADEDAEALEELEEEELELLEDEAAEALLVDEAAELRAIRRAELTLDADAEEIRENEFVCSSCYLVKRVSQLANKRKLICKDCAS